MKARTGMMFGSLLLLASIAQAHENVPAKPAVIKLATQPHFDLADPAVRDVIRASAAGGGHLACENGATQDPPVENVRAPASRATKAAPAAPRRRRLGCDSFHCVADKDARPAAESSIVRPRA
jgi:hypothetical protein